MQNAPLEQGARLADLNQRRSANEGGGGACDFWIARVEVEKMTWVQEVER